MPILHEPSISLEGVKVRAARLSSVDLDVAILVQNKNPVGITLREIPFVVLVRDGERQTEIADGNTGAIKVKARDSTAISVPLTSKNSAIVRAAAGFVAGRGLEVTVKGTAVVDALVTGLSVPFEKTVALTAAGVAGALTKKRNNP
ncbi:MAG: LEA type 2 family protein [Methanoregula sp.]|nr:MAG: LEA type 2 family protein [Methanoregula sp.]